MYDICCIGHITSDRVVNHTGEIHMPGGTAYYFANALQFMPVSYNLVTAVGPNEMAVVTGLQAKGVTVKALPSAHSVYFENIYMANQDHRTQRVLQKAVPFKASDLADIDARIFHLGPLLADDIPVDMIKSLSERGLISLDVQGYLRQVQQQNVIAANWPLKTEALSYVHTLKANEFELEALTGCSHLQQGAQMLHQWGVQKVVITLGSKGSVIYADDVFYNIPAYTPASLTDATGGGDTYMAGYLYQRIKGAGIQQAGEFASAMASLKIETAGPFNGTEEDVRKLLANYKG